MARTALYAFFAFLAVPTILAGHALVRLVEVSLAWAFPAYDPPAWTFGRYWRTEASVATDARSRVYSFTARRLQRAAGPALAPAYA